MNEHALKRRWSDLFADIDPVIVELEFDNLSDYYAESHRYYHTLDHISDCLDRFDEIKQELSEPFSVELAIWYHDVIYEPKNKDNEEQSALFAMNHLKILMLDADLLKTIRHLIELTKHPSIPDTNDEKYLLDIDLSILGADATVYDRYAADIRKEYAHIPAFVYKFGRKKILENFLATEKIYHTDVFSRRFENCARQNIKRELAAK